MDVRLVVEKGTTGQRTWHLHHKDTVVGRRRDCDLRILSAEVSRRHCVLSIDDGSVNVEDLDSINGTFVNGSRVVGKQVLHPGDHLEIGPLEFIVEYELPPGQGRLEQQRPAAQEAIAVENADEHAIYDVPPLVEEESQRIRDQASQDEEEPLPVLDDAEAADWHLPQTTELRDLLARMDQPEAVRKRGQTP
jgi:pSer/pThr/pTyr-binding forkhead associated (FHA) protein